MTLVDTNHDDGLNIFVTVIGKMAFCFSNADMTRATA